MADIAGFAAELGAWGYTDFWAGESDRADGFTPLALASTAEPPLQLGTAIVPVFTRGRALLAQSAATMADAAPGRFTLGIGASSPAIVHGWNATSYGDPLGRVRATTAYLRAAFEGDKMAGGFRLASLPEQPPGIAVGALQPKMLRLAGEVGDGVVLTSLAASDVTRLLEHVDPQRRPFTVVAWVTVCVVDSGASLPEALRVARRRIGRYLLTPTYARYHRWLGRGDDLDHMGSNPDAAPDSLMRDLVVMGTAEQCRAQLQEFHERGVDVLLYEVLPGFADLRETLAALAPTGPTR